jgi:hypothetical protein
MNIGRFSRVEAGTSCIEAHIRFVETEDVLDVPTGELGQVRNETGGIGSPVNDMIRCSAGKTSVRDV